MLRGEFGVVDQGEETGREAAAREQGLRAAGLSGLANFQMVAHNPNSPFYGMPHPAMAHLRDYLDTDNESANALERFIRDPDEVLLNKIVDRRLAPHRAENGVALRISQLRDATRRLESRRGFSPLGMARIAAQDAIAALGGLSKGPFLKRNAKKVFLDRDDNMKRGKEIAPRKERSAEEVLLRGAADDMYRGANEKLSLSRGKYLKQRMPRREKAKIMNKLMSDFRRVSKDMGYAQDEYNIFVRDGKIIKRPKGG